MNPTSNYGKAIHFFKAATLANSSYADAFYFLGLIHQRLNDLPKAEQFFTEAIKHNPAHEGALGKINAQKKTAGSAGSLSSYQSSPPGLASHTKVQTPKETIPATGGSEFYQQLLEDPTPVAKKVVSLIDELELHVTPSFMSHLGSILLRTAKFTAKAMFTIFFVGVFLVVLYNFTTQGGPGFRMPAFLSVSNVILLLLTLILIRLILYGLEVRNKKYEVSKGKIKLTDGLLNRKVTTIELYRITEVESSQDVFNQMTGYGTLMMTVLGNDKKVELIGICRADNLQYLVDRLRELIVLLRSINWIKGIVT